MLDTKASRNRPLSPAVDRGCRLGLRRQCVRCSQQALHLGQQRGAGSAQGHRALGALEQPRTQGAFKRLDRLRQRRLRHVQPRGGSAVVQLFGRNSKLAQGPELDRQFTVRIKRRGLIDWTPKPGSFDTGAPR